MATKSLIISRIYRPGICHPSLSVLVRLLSSGSAYGRSLMFLHLQEDADPYFCWEILLNRNVTFL
uniref:Uncharacterized protein n=1 Tax=Pan paniscus TaxID=9597 RepID=A0A2R8ZFS6_PANPA